MLTITLELPDDFEAFVKSQGYANVNTYVETFFLRPTMERYRDAENVKVVAERQTEIDEKVQGMRDKIKVDIKKKKEVEKPE